MTRYLNRALLGAFVMASMAACDTGTSGDVSVKSPINLAGAKTDADISEPAKAAESSGALVSLFEKVTGSAAAVTTSRRKTAQDRCSEGGEEDFSNSGSKLRVTYTNCVDINQVNGTTVRTELNNSVDLEVGLSSFESDTFFGPTGAAFRTDIRSPASGTAVADATTELFGSLFQEFDSSGENVRSTLNLDGTGTNNLNADGFDFFTENLVIDVTDAGSTIVVDVDGLFGISTRSASANCNSGQVTIATLEQLTIDENSGDVLSGSLELTSGTQRATVDFVGDNVMVSVDGQGSATFTQAEFSAFCDI